MSDNKIAVTEHNTMLRPIATPKEVLHMHQDITAIIQQGMQKDLDYGKIPGTDKDCLLKAGAEKIAAAFGARAQYDIVESDTEHDRQNVYPDRQGNLRKSLGFYRYIVKCTLKAGDRVHGEGIGSCSTMESRYISRPRDSENTVLKMAKKRALVAAVLGAYALSNRFTQDMEDLGPPPSRATAKSVLPTVTNAATRQDAQPSGIDDVLAGL